MGFIAKDSGGDYKRVPSGSHIARCYSLIDLGTQRTNGQYGEKDAHKIQIGWELFGEDDAGAPLTIERDGKAVPMTIKKSYTLSLHEKASLRKDLASWRGRDFTEEEAAGFDIANLLGAPCMLSCTESTSGGKTYTNVQTISRLPASLKNALPEAVHQQVIFDLDNPDMKIFNTFHEKLQEAIKASPEWRLKSGATESQPAEQSNKTYDDFSGDIPF